MTDGVISDKENTVAEIVKASELPLSIIIIGLGSKEKEFHDMKL
jgi:hypothetical protein